MNAAQRIKKDFKVIDTIRFISICLIVWGHSSLGMESHVFHSTNAQLLQSLSIQMGKIGTIMFFLISGFLLEPKIESYSILSFVKSRLKSTILPWILFVTLFAAINLMESQTLRDAITAHSYFSMLGIIAETFKNIILYVAYWFIIVFFISVSVLITFKKYIHTSRMGIALAVITLFYCVNLHYGWISAHHTKAFFGYTLFVWVGIQISRNYENFNKFLRNTSWWMIGSAFGITLIVACYEGFILTKGNCVDPYASIRFSNVINTLVLFIALFKLGKLQVIDQLNPRQNVYGIYLLHNILLLVQGHLLKQYTISMPDHIFGYLSCEVLNFIAITGLSLIMVAGFKTLQAEPLLLHRIWIYISRPFQHKYQVAAHLIITFGFYFMLNQSVITFSGTPVEIKGTAYL